MPIYKENLGLYSTTRSIKPQIFINSRYIIVLKSSMFSSCKGCLLLIPSILSTLFMKFLSKPKLIEAPTAKICSPLMVWAINKAQSKTIREQARRNIVIFPQIKRINTPNSEFHQWEMRTTKLIRTQRIPPNLTTVPKMKRKRNLTVSSGKNVLNKR